MLKEPVIREVLRQHFMLRHPHLDVSADRVPRDSVDAVLAMAAEPSLVLFHRDVRPAASIEDASRTFQRLRDASGEGGSTWPDALILGGGQVFRVSYNGRVWRGTEPPASSPDRVCYVLEREADGRKPGEPLAAVKDPWAINRVIVRAHGPEGVDEPQFCTIVLSRKVMAEFAAATRMLAEPALAGRMPEVRWTSEHAPRFGLHRLAVLPDAETSTFEKDYALDASKLVVQRDAAGVLQVSALASIRCEGDLQVYTFGVPLDRLVAAAEASVPVTFLDTRADELDGAALEQEYRIAEREWFDGLSDDEHDSDSPSPSP